MGKPQKVSYEVIARGDEPELYSLLEDLVGEYHDHLLEAKIALAWCYSWKVDPDGILVLGKCKKASDLDRQLHDQDFIILLNREMWENVGFSAKQKRALLDHELCHADAARDEDGEQKETADGRKVWRTRKHDLEEFQCIVERHGCWKKHIEEFARAALEKAKRPLLRDQEPEVESITFGSGPNATTFPREEVPS